MRPASNSTAVAAATGAGFEFRHWNSPIPFLFGGLALMLGLIAAALLILACSYTKSSSNNNNSHGEAEEKQPATEQVMKPLEMEPKIVVIMAGDENPTYLANPVSSTRLTQQV